MVVEVGTIVADILIPKQNGWIKITVSEVW